MIAYYVHWHYPPTADNAHYYAGKDDDKLFHHKENAEKYAKDKINEWNDNSRRSDYLYNKEKEYGLTVEEQKERDILLPIVCGDLPDDYIICERDIKFEDDKLIDINILVSEIKRLAEVGRNNASAFDEYRKENAVWLQQADVCDRILSFINTIV